MNISVAGYNPGPFDPKLRIDLNDVLDRLSRAGRRAWDDLHLPKRLVLSHDGVLSFTFEYISHDSHGNEMPLWYYPVHVRSDGKIAFNDGDPVQGHPTAGDTAFIRAIDAVVRAEVKEWRHDPDSYSPASVKPPVGFEGHKDRLRNNTGYRVLMYFLALVICVIGIIIVTRI